MKEKLLKVKNIYKNMSPPVKASFWFTICNILQKGIALFSTPILTRILTQEQYGTYSIFQSWYSIVTIFATVNLFQNAYTKGLVQYEDHQKELGSSLLGLTSFITVGVFGVYIVNPSFWSKIFNLSPMLISVMFIEIFFISAFEFWAASQRFEYRYRWLVVISLVMSVGSLLLGIVAILSTKYKVEARIFSDALVKCIIGGALYVNIILRGKSFYNKSYWKYALTFNMPLIPHFLSHFLLNQSDRIMIGKLVGNGEAAIYSVAYSISMMMFLVTNAINNSFTPYTYKKIKNNDSYSIRMHSKLLFLFVCLLCVLTMSFAPEVIRIFAGPEYYDAIWVIPPVATSVYFIFVYSMFSNIEYYYKKTTGISIASVICAVLNLVLNYFFISKYGYYAAGYTTLLSYICLTLMHYLLYRKIIVNETSEKMEIYNIKFIVLCAIIVITMMGIMIIAYNSFMIRFGIIIFITIVIFIKRKEILHIFNF